MVQNPSTDILNAAEEHVREFFRANIPTEFVFHDLQHTINVVQAAQELAEGAQLGETETEQLLLAAWFHDLGYDQGPEQHEVRSCEYATTFLNQHEYAEEGIHVICACIMATRYPHQPDNNMEAMLCDADLSHLGKKNYWVRCGKLRQEIAYTKKHLMSEQEWIEFELNFVLQHQYHTEVANLLYGDIKQKHVRQLHKHKARLNPDLPNLVPPKKKKKKKKNKQSQTNKSKDIELKELRLGRGVETMYRTTYRTHISLSAIADNKANIMLSINAIIISIVISTLVPSFNDNTKLILPTIVLLTVCLAAMVYATLSTRPKITEGKFNRQDIELKRSNLLFFGNYYNMELDDFHWGMREMIKDSDFLYSSMTRDLYFLGKVLAKKYKYLRICYAIFMYGLIAAVLSFAVTFII